MRVVDFAALAVAAVLLGCTDSSTGTEDGDSADSLINLTVTVKDAATSDVIPDATVGIVTKSLSGTDVGFEKETNAEGKVVFSDVNTGYQAYIYVLDSQGSLRAGTNDWWINPNDYANNGFTARVYYYY